MEKAPVSDLEAPVPDTSKTSDAKTYYFTMRIKNAIPNGAKLTFQVSGTDKDGQAIKGDTAL